MNFIALVHIFIFLFLDFGRCSNFDSSDLKEAETVVVKSEAKVLEWKSFSTNILLYITDFLKMPQRELGAVSKYFKKLFETELKFSSIINRRFNIPQLVSAETFEDLKWFNEEKRLIFKRTPNHFFLLLSSTIFKNKVFSVNRKFVLEYFLKNYVYYCLNSMEELCYFHQDLTFSNMIRDFLHENKHFDLLAQIIIKDPSLLSIRHGILPDTIGFDLGFYAELVSESNGGLKNLFDFFNAQQNIVDKYIIISRFLLSDKSEFILLECLKLLKNIEDQSILVKESFTILFDQFWHFSDFTMQELNEIYEQNLMIFFNRNITKFIETTYLKKFKILNEIYFGPEYIISDEFINGFSYHGDQMTALIKSSIQSNRKFLFSKLLNINQVYDRIRHDFYIFRKNFLFYFQVLEKDRQKKVNSIFYPEKIFEFYNLTNFIPNLSSASGVLIFQLKPQFQHQNIELPTVFDFNFYNEDELGFGFAFEYMFLFHESLRNCSGSNDYTLIEFSKYCNEWLEDNISETIAVTDEILLIILSSETLRDLIFNSKFRITIKLTPIQAIKMLKNNGHTIQDIQNLQVVYEDVCFEEFTCDSDFNYFKELSNQTIVNYLITNIIPIMNNTPFLTFLTIRNALHYVLRHENILELLNLNPNIIEFLRKEAPNMTRSIS